MSRAKNFRFYFLLSKFFRFLLVLVLITAWIFSSWPQIFNFPPEVQEAKAAPYPNGYSFRRLIDITDAQVSNGPHTNFPILFNSTILDLRTTANGGDVTDAEGDDIIFTDSNGTTQLAHEVEKYTATTGELVAWVRVPSLAATSTIYIYYGNSSVTTFQGSVPGSVWNTNYKSVWHMNTSSWLDSASTGNTLTANGGATTGTGKVGTGLVLDGTGDWLSGNYSNFDNASAGTYEFWLYYDTAVSADGFFTTNNVQPGIFNSGGTALRGNIDSSLGRVYDWWVSGSLSTGVWMHFVVTFDSTIARLYKNGTQIGQDSTPAYTLDRVTNYVYIGTDREISGRDVDGTMDEVRISNSVRSAGWILTGYNNQNSPSGFYAIGAEETNPAFTQSAYRLFNNLNSTDVGSPLTTFANGYSFRRLIDITDAQVSAGPHTNFPVLASTTLADLRTTANGGDVTDAQGDDIIFTDSDGTTQFAHEVEKYATTTGEFVAWVRVPSLASTSALYMYYGNSSVTTFQGNVTSNGVTGVWDTNYTGVWHLKEDPSGTAPQMKDSTSNVYHGTTGGTMTSTDQVAGQVDGSLELDGANDWVDFPDAQQTIPNGSPFTISSWVYAGTSATDEYNHVLFGRTSNGVSKYAYGIATNQSSAGTDFRGTVSNGTSAQSAACPSVSINTWTHLVVVLNGNQLTCFKNGVAGTPVTITLSGTYPQVPSTYDYGESMFRGYSGVGFLAGTFDEVRVSNSARSAGWISTEYNNQNSPSGFYTVGAETVKQDTAATLGSAGAAFRLRMLLHISDAQLGLSGQNFKLQFAQQSGTCDTAFSGETYADVTATTVIAYNNNATPADGDNLTANANDPTHGSDTIVNQDYEELNNFTNSVAAIPSGQDGKWDFSLIDNGATAGTAYCFRAVKSDGNVLDTYTVIPQITTAAAVATVSCSTNVSSTSFGTLTTASVFTASPNASTTMSCSNTTLGCTLYVKDAGGGGNPGLWNATSSSLIASPNGTSTLQGGVVEGYGIQATTTSPGLTIGIRYNQTGNTVGGLSLSDFTLASSTADISNAEAIVTHKAAITALRLSGIYEDTITYSCTVNL